MNFKMNYKWLILGILLFSPLKQSIVFPMEEARVKLLESPTETVASKEFLAQLVALTTDGDLEGLKALLHDQDIASIVNTRSYKINSTDQISLFSIAIIAYAANPVALERLSLLGDSSTSLSPIERGFLALGKVVNVMYGPGIRSKPTPTLDQHLLILRFLLEHGANPNICSNTDRILDEHPALSYAVIYNCPEIISCLIEHGARVNLSNNGFAPIHFAAMTGTRDTIMTLVRHGANPNQSLNRQMSGTCNSLSPLVMAAIAKNRDGIVALQELGADENQGHSACCFCCFFTTPAYEYVKLHGDSSPEIIALLKRPTQSGYCCILL
ncbi:MAG TPA: ankyrin repeat domain-containing protein [Candidatus Babeliales bacterium]|nr:ankyrin repeat domain-containing protein [Candidatus Babeliales bacterium]